MPTRVAPSNSQEDLDGEAGAEVRADSFQPSKLNLNLWPMPSRRCRSLMRPTQMADVAVGACRQTSAESAEDLATGHFSAHPEEVRAGGEEDDKDTEEEEDGMLAVEVDQVKCNLLLWLSRGQNRLGVYCNQPPTVPQGPMVVTRKTSCALSWPARTAVGAVGRSGVL